MCEKKNQVNAVLFLFGCAAFYRRPLLQVLRTMSFRDMPSTAMGNRSQYGTAGAAWSRLS